MPTSGSSWTQADAGQRHTVSLVLRPPAKAGEVGQQLLSGAYDFSAATQADLAADPADLQAAVDFIQKNGLQLIREDAGARTIHASGTVEQLQSAFGISLGASAKEDGSVGPMHPKEAVVIPAELNGPVIAVLGLDQRPIARHHDAG